MLQKRDISAENAGVFTKKFQDNADFWLSINTHPKELVFRST